MLDITLFENIVKEMAVVKMKYGKMLITDEGVVVSSIAPNKTVLTYSVLPHAVLAKPFAFEDVDAIINKFKIFSDKEKEHVVVDVTEKEEFLKSFTMKKGRKSVEIGFAVPSIIKTPDKIDSGNVIGAVTFDNVILDSLNKAIRAYKPTLITFIGDEVSQDVFVELVDATGDKYTDIIGKCTQNFRRSWDRTALHNFLKQKDYSKDLVIYGNGFLESTADNLNFRFIPMVE